MEDLNTDNTAEKQQKRIIGKPFEKGQSGNPAGRPLGSLSITAEIKKKLSEVPEGQQKTYLEILVSKILKKAIQEEDFQTQKQIWNYIDGLPKSGTESFSRFNIREVREPEPFIDPDTKARIKRIVELQRELDMIEAEEREEKLRKENNNQIS